MHKKDVYIYTSYILLTLLIPVVGLLITLLMIARRRYAVERDFHTRFAHLEHHAEEIHQIKKPSHDQEINIVPIEEALIINDVNTRRQLLLNLLKKDALQQMEVLKKAVNNQDTETAHYAASALLEVRRKLLLLQQQLANEYESKKAEVDFLYEYSKAIKFYLDNGFLDRNTELYYKKLYAQVLIDIFVAGKRDVVVFLELIDAHMDLQDYGTSSDYCRLFIESYHDREEPYVYMLKLCFLQKNIDEMKSTMDQLLRRKTITLTMNTVSLIRYWQRGIMN